MHECLSFRIPLGLLHGWAVGPDRHRLLLLQDYSEPAFLRNERNNLPATKSVLPIILFHLDIGVKTGKILHLNLHVPGNQQKRSVLYLTPKKSPANISYYTPIITP